MGHLPIAWGPDLSKRNERDLRRHRIDAEVVRKPKDATN